MLVDDATGQVTGDASHGLSKGFVCDRVTMMETLRKQTHRIQQPFQRVGDQWRPLSWSAALSMAGERLSGLLHATGVEGMALYAGNDVVWSARDWSASHLFRTRLGLGAIYTDRASFLNGHLLATREMLGTSAILKPDVERSQFTLLLCSALEDNHWGPWMSGTIQQSQIERQQQNYGSNVAEVGAWNSQNGVTQRANIRPGTEVFFLAGVLHTLLENSWVDSQYIQNHTTGMLALKTSIAGWTAQRCAQLCDVDVADLNAIALRFSRAATGCIVIGKPALLSGKSTLLNGLMLAICAVTGNLMRPGGLWAGSDLLSVDPWVLSMRRGKPKGTRVSGLSSQDGQWPTPVLAAEVLRPGDGQTKGLVCLGGDPIRSGHPQMARAIRSLDVLIYAGSYWNETATLADFVFPLTLPYEQADSNAHRQGQMPRRFVQHSKALWNGPTEARSAAQVCSGLSKTMRWRRGWMRHLASSIGDKIGLERGTRFAFRLLSDVSWSEVEQAAGGLDLGPADRAHWAVTHADERVQLCPSFLETALGELTEPESGHGLVLGCREARHSGASRIWVHPQCARRIGLKQGDLVAVNPVESKGVEVEGAPVVGSLECDEGIREDTVVVETNWLDVADTQGQERVNISQFASMTGDPFVGTPRIHGVPVCLRKMARS